MTFDFIRGDSISYMVPYNPDPFPGFDWAPNGFWLNFTSNDQRDANHCVNVVWRENGRSTVSPSRQQGYGFLNEHFTGGVWNAYVCNPVATGTGSPHMCVAADGIPTLIGKVAILSTNSQLGSVAGLAWTNLGTIPNSYGWDGLLSTWVGSTNAADALHVWSRNNYGTVLKIRFYDSKAEVYTPSGWTFLAEISKPLHWIFECWVMQTDHGDGTFTIQLYRGTQAYGTPYTGAIPASSEIPKNSISVLQQSGANNYRVGMVMKLAIGVTQLPDNMDFCTPAYVSPISPTVGYFKVAFEDVSRSVVPGTNFRAYLTKEGIGSWAEVNLESYGSIGKGELAVGADVKVYAGSCTFPPGSGTSMRAHITTTDGIFPVLQGITAYWDAE